MEKSFLNFIKSNQICIAISLFRLILHQTEFQLVPYQLRKCYYNLNLVSFNKIEKRFIRVNTNLVG